MIKGLMTVPVQDIKVKCQRGADGMFYVYFYDLSSNSYITDPLNSIGMLILVTCKSQTGELLAIRQSDTCLLWDYACIYHQMSIGDNTVMLQDFSKTGWEVPQVEPMIFNDVNDLVNWAKQNMLLELL